MSNAVTTQPQSLVAKFAAKYSIEPTRLLDTLKSTAFRQGGNGEVSNEQMAALLIVADQYGLNPFTKEIYAFPDKGGIVPVVGVDGWARIINEHPQCDGFEFKYADDTRTFENKDVPIWMEVHIFRKDRARPVIVREYFDEVVRSGMQPWKPVGHKRNLPVHVDGHHARCRAEYFERERGGLGRSLVVTGESFLHRAALGFHCSASSS
ncbi:recombinase RecT [Burkholderia sp. PAMC 28687]|uniref:recombinase RecT n=1 Tax=Burkholderia sp. PAMC 28687 TaxID=1795874 RepID=UPI0009E93051|nr:recombinase RecT [Burkholderia sp. PAMC 28687]